MKLKVMAGMAILNGWLKEKAPKVMDNQMPPGKSTRLIEIIFRKGAPSTGFGKHYSASDILFDHEAMECLTGEKAVCMSYLCRFYPESSCVIVEGECDNFIPKYLYVMLEAAKLPTDEERIDYVYNIIKGGFK